MTEKEAHERFIKAVTDCFDDCLNRAIREYVTNLRPHMTDKQREEFDTWLRDDKAVAQASVASFIQGLPFEKRRKGDLSRAERLDRESQLRRGFFKWARGFIRKPAAGGRPRKLTPEQAAAIVERVSALLAQDSTRQDAFEAVARSYEVSVSTVRRAWVDYRKSRAGKAATAKRRR